jgi:hypothetical protein
MKRAISVCIAAAALAGASGCSPAPAGRDDESASGAAAMAVGWTKPPVIESVARSGSDLVVVGRAEPGARVVLRGASGDARAAVAGAAGRFDIRMEAPVDSVLLQPETQNGQDAVASPDRLLLIDGGRGPIAILRPGAATRRLDAAPSLGAVDGDGRQRIASGRAAAGTRSLDVWSGEARSTVAPEPSGFWTLMLPPEGGQPLRIGARSFGWSGEGPRRVEGLSVERRDGGWSVDWSGAGGARQWTWLPVD